MLCLITILPTLSQKLLTEPNLISVPRASLEKALKVKVEYELCVKELKLTQDKVLLCSNSTDLYKLEIENLTKVLNSKDLIIVETNKTLNLKEDQIKTLKKEKSSKLKQGLLIGFVSGIVTFTLAFGL